MTSSSTIDSEEVIVTGVELTLLSACTTMFMIRTWLDPGARTLAERLPRRSAASLDDAVNASLSDLEDVVWQSTGEHWTRLAARTRAAKRVAFRLSRSQWGELGLVVDVVLREFGGQKWSEFVGAAPQQVHLLPVTPTREDMETIRRRLPQAPSPSANGPRLVIEGDEAKSPADDSSIELDLSGRELVILAGSFTLFSTYSLSVPVARALVRRYSKESLGILDDKLHDHAAKLWKTSGLEADGAWSPPLIERRGALRTTLALTSTEISMLCAGIEALQAEFSGEMWSDLVTLAPGGFPWYRVTPEDLVRLARRLHLSLS